MSEDKKLEYIKQKKLFEMRKRLFMKKTIETQKEVHSRDTVKKMDITRILADNAGTVWQAAKQQYPKKTQEVEKALLALFKAGKLKQKVTGEQLNWLFKQLGSPIRFKTKIRILENGELKTIADKLQEK